jgi:hypothetical protein
VASTVGCAVISGAAAPNKEGFVVKKKDNKAEFVQAGSPATLAVADQERIVE